MKTNHWVALPATVAAMCTVASLPCAAQGNSGHNQTVFPAMPSGWLTAFPTIVQTGTHPTLTWGINYPSIVEDYITITPPSTITADEEVDCEIRILGAGVTVTTNNSGYTFVPTQAQVSYDGGSYTQIFYGTNPQVNPNTLVYTKTMAKNKKLRFGGRYKYNNTWGPYFNSSSGTQNVRTLVNGSTPPSNVPDYNAPSLEQFIKPYLTPDGKVKIGPMDAIVFMELTHTDSQMSDPGYDLQDMVLLVTFKSKAKTNNGHGNNIDGIDSSNPGNAPFINLDTDPDVDDEGGGGGAAPSDP
jgi:hypothetical protein